jgi:hypothetical protein
MTGTLDILCFGFDVDTHYKRDCQLMRRMYEYILRFVPAGEP